MKLNPAKCVFGVEAGKFLGFMVNHRGIEVNPAKAQAVMDLQHPQTVKEVQRLIGIVAALSRFMFRSTDKCLPFFQALKSKGNINWNGECEEAFQGPKTYLASPPLLSKPLPGEVLYLYLAISEKAVNFILV